MLMYLSTVMEVCDWDRVLVDLSWMNEVLHKTYHWKEPYAHAAQSYAILP